MRIGSDRVLQIEGLRFGYTPDRLLYDGFNLTLHRGEVVSIVGGSGSGKSTLLELITSELRPQAGTIQTGRISQIFQDPYSSFHQSYAILPQIEEVADTSNLPDYLPRLGLEYELLLQKPHRLSGGQLQRCSILRALLMQPDLLLADEPTSALDNIIALEVMRVLMGFLDRVGIVLITHDRDLARWASDRIVDIEALQRGATP